MLVKLCAFKQNRTATNFVVNLSLKQIHRIYIQTPADFFGVCDVVEVGDEFGQAKLQVAAFVALE